MSTKLSRREMLKLTGTVAAGTLLAACGQQAQPTTAPQVTEEVKAPQATTPPQPKKAEGTVTIMHQRNELSEDQQKQFETDNPGIKMAFVENDLTRFFAMIAAGTPPDLYRTQAPIIPQLLARKLLFDLTPFFQTSEVLKLDDLMPANDYYKANSPLEVGKGPIHGMVKDFSPDLTIFANTKLFADAGLPAPDDTKPMTYDEVHQIATKTTKMEGDRVINMGYGYEHGWLDRIMMVALSEKDQKLFSPAFDKIVLKDNEETMKLAKYYFDLAKEKVTDSPINPSPNGWFGTDFTANILAMCQYGFWYSAMAVTDQNKGNVVMLPAPTWSGKRVDPTITATGMIMLSKTKVPEAAWKVFEWYNGLQPAVDRAKSGWGVPGLKSMLSMIPQESDYQKQVNKVLQGEMALSTPPVQFNPFIGEGVFPDAWNKNIDQALKGTITFEEMVANVETEVNTAIKEGIDRITG